MSELRIRSAPARRWLGSVRADLGHVRADLLAGLPSAVSNLPGGMAAAVLAGVKPIQGVYACFAGPIAGGLTAHTRMMIITTTAAVALAAGSALSSVSPSQRPAAMGLLTLLVGAVLLAAGILRLGRYTRFVSHSVMIGFLTGISVNIVCGQLSGLTGAKGRGPNAIAQALSIVVHPGRIDPAALLTGAGALLILAALARTRIAPASTLLAVALPTLVVAATAAHSVARVRSIGPVTPGIPAPELPAFHLLTGGVVAGALAVAAIILVQSTGVSEVTPNDDSLQPDVNRDSLAESAGNLASSVFGGIPVGGSLGQTTISQHSGAKTRWASIWSGVWTGVILIAFSPAVGEVAVPTLSAVLIFFGLTSFQLGEIRTIWRTGPSSQVALLTTFTATLLLPVTVAVAIGVAMSLLLQLNRDAIDLTVVELIPLPDGRLAEAAPPPALPSGKVTVVDVYGSLLYAGARTLRAQLPDPSDSSAAALVLRLRGRTAFGSTFVKVVTDYADSLDRIGGRLYLSGLDPGVADRLRAASRPDGPVHAISATPVIGESTYAAFLEAESWLASQEEG